MITQEQLKETVERKDALKKYLDVDNKKIQIEEEELRTHVPDFWEHPKEAQAQMKKIKDLQAWVNGYQDVETAVDELSNGWDFYKEELLEEAELDALYTDAVKKIEALELRNMLRGEEDKMGAIMDINAGAGGTEALDWASMLLRMYTRWCDARGYKYRMMDYQAGDEVGVKSCTLEIEGDFAYGYLKSENGVHRMVRLSPFNANNKRQTTFASVFVSPAVDDTIEITVNPADIDWDTFR